jgi:hypothetical protein
VRVAFDARRLPGAEQVKAWVSFDGKLREQPIHLNRAGGPSSCEFIVPPGTKTFEIWFEGNARGDESSGAVVTIWDSDYARNYRFQVEGSDESMEF